ncbi:MAG: APC family permease [Haloarculaceae archaeon]
MGESKLGLGGAAAIGLGGMIGGGVFSVLGVVVSIAGAASWAAFTAASLISMCAAYSYIKLNEAGSNLGGSVTQLEEFVGNSTLAGMIGWTLLVGYVGAMAMYAFAFGSFAVRLLPGWLAGSLPMRPVLSVIGVALFVGLNVAGARATGRSEEALVATKISILLIVSVWGLYYGWQQGAVSIGLSRMASVGLVTATAISFVSFQGWQLLVYDYDSIKDPLSTIPKAIYLSIVGAIIVDSLVAILVTSLVKTSVIQADPEIAVAHAVQPFLGHIGFVFIALAALFSTGSAINGTLFSAAHFAKGMLSDDLVPQKFGDADASGAPERTLLLLGLVTAVFTAYGSLEGITSFGSLAFMVVFGVMSGLALYKRDELDVDVNPVIPAIGLLGTAAFFPILLWHLYTTEWGVFLTVVALAVAVVGVEVIYFERDTIVRGVEEEI